MNAIKIALSLALSGLVLAPLSAGAAKHEVDPAHTYVLFKVNHLGIGNSWGMFRKTTGTFDPDKGTLDITIDANSIYTADKKRDDHLKGPDFFDTKQFPKITFESTKVETKGDEYMVTGDLTLKGKTKPVTLTVAKTGEGKDPWGNFRTGFETSVTINRMDFGVDYMPDGLSKDVELMISVEGIRK